MEVCTEAWTQKDPAKEVEVQEEVTEGTIEEEAELMQEAVDQTTITKTQEKKTLA